VDDISVQKCLETQHELDGKHMEVKRAVRKEEIRNAAAGGGGGGGGYDGGYG
jgi:heterogeneous nuclear ribonucleoprotein A1/A3